MNRLRRLGRDERGNSQTVSITLGLVPFWLLVTVVVVVAMLGLRRASAALATHDAGLAAGRLDAAAGESAAEHVLNVWWGDPSAGSGQGVPVTVTEGDRFVVVELDHRWGTTAEEALGALSVRASSFQRKEGFYAGPADPNGFE